MSAARASRRASLLGASMYVVATLALFGALGLSLGWRSAGIAGATLLVAGTIPGAALVRVLLPRAGLLHYLVLGTTLGIMLWALGGFLSAVTGVFVVRWIPSALAVVLLVTLCLLKRVPRERVLTPLPVSSAAGAVIGIIAMTPALRTALATQPASWAGWRSVYADLPFQSAIAAEVAARVPDQLSWVAGTPLSYTWAFHSAVGVWSSTSSVPAFDLVLQAWPVMFTALIPGAIAIIAWELSRNPWVAGLAPVVFALAHGVLISPQSFVQLPLFSVSPTRDFGDLAMLVVILCLVKTIGRRSIRALSVRWLVALGLAMVVATAAKGSELPVLLGGLATACLILLVRRRLSWSDAIASAVFVVGAVVGFVIAIPDAKSAQSLGWGPLTFLSTGSLNAALLSAALVGVLLAGIVGFWLVIGRGVNWTLSSLLAGTMLAGLTGLSLLTQTGGSQNYFWQATEPLVAIAIAWSVVLLTRTYGTRVIVVVLGIAVLGNIGLAVTTNPLLLCAGLAVSAVAGTLVVLFGAAGPRQRRHFYEVIMVALVLAQCAQIVNVSPGFIAGSLSTAEDEAATDGSQLSAFEFIRTHSKPDDVIATNTHCLTGSLASNDCDPRRFILAAVSQRRVLVEGWGYATQYGNSRSWVQGRLDASDDFIDAPTATKARSLHKLGVDWIYVDLRLGPSPDLGLYSQLVFASDWARVYRLR